MTGVRGDVAGGNVLVAAISARALAQSAHRGGYLPLSADFFGDQDTRAVAAAHVVLAGDFRRGFGAAELMAALAGLAAGRTPVGVVCGTGFEDRPQLLARIARRWPLLGNGADAVGRTKDPFAFAAVCRDLDVPFPEVSLAPPARGPFVGKRRGGSGGGHVVSDDVVSDDVVSREVVRHDAARGAEVYYQARAPGVPVSALILADGRSARVLGFSTQWANPAPRRPFRYGGAVQPAGISGRLASRLERAACSLSAAFALKGLNSADFMVDGDDFQVVEINPRPGATLDIFESADGPSLFALHVAACAGSLAAVATAQAARAGATAAAVSYAAHDAIVPDGFQWPHWCADRPAGGLAIRAGDPLCTVHASAATAAEARALSDARLALVDACTRRWTGREEQR